MEEAEEAVAVMLPYIVQHVLPAMKEVLSYCLDRYVFGIPISYPGDEIANPQHRIGTWKEKTTTTKNSDQWTFACDAESHAVTKEQLEKAEYEASGIKEESEALTGESAGRQIWYVSQSKAAIGEDVTFDPSVNPNSSDKLFRNQKIREWVKKGGKIPNAKATSAREASHLALSFYEMLQCDDGHWAGDYGGPMFLMPGLICAIYITKSHTKGALPEVRKNGMIDYLLNHQQRDGGWGTHIECASTMFGTGKKREGNVYQLFTITLACFMYQF